MPLTVALPVIALAALLLATVPAVAQVGLSALPLAILFGMLYGNFYHKPASDVDLRFSKFCKQTLLRGGIVLFGFGLSFQAIMAVGWAAVVLDAIVIISIFTAGTVIGVRWFGLQRDLAMLISVGSAVCGAAAILATESAIKARTQDVTIAVSTVVLFGTLAMFIYPFVYPVLEMSAQAFGIYIGSSVHEVAQAVAAGGSVSVETMKTAVVVKLIRVMMLAPFIIILSWVLSRRRASSEDGGTTNVAVPWFVFGFIGAAGLNSVLNIAPFVSQALQYASQLLLAFAMAALGAQTQWHNLKSAGLKPMLLALTLFVFLMVGGYGLNRLLIIGV